MTTELMAEEPSTLYESGLAALQAGQLDQAKDTLIAAAKRLPGDHEVRYALYSVLKALGEDGFAELSLIDAMQLQAEDHIRKIVGGEALEQCRGSAEGMNELAQLLYKKNQMGLASFCLQEALAMKADSMGIWLSLGLALQHQSRIQEAQAVYRNVVRSWPNNAAAHSFLHYALFFGDLPKMTLYEEGQRWNAAHAAARMPAALNFPNERNPERRLKIGYFSPIFSQHQLSHFLEPILANHDRGQFEIYCYSGSDNAADPTQRAGRR